MTDFDEEGFRQYLDGLNYANARVILRYARRCFEQDVTVPRDVDETTFPGTVRSTRAKYRNALCRYGDYLKTVEATA